MVSPMKKLQCNHLNRSIFWLKDESLEDMENLPDPDTIASNIAENLESALEQFRNIYENLEKQQKGI